MNTIYEGKTFFIGRSFAIEAKTNNRHIFHNIYIGWKITIPVKSKGGWRIIVDLLLSSLELIFKSESVLRKKKRN